MGAVDQGVLEICNLPPLLFRVYMTKVIRHLRFAI
jgi:hypothetical protein